MLTKSLIQVNKIVANGYIESTHEIFKSTDKVSKKEETINAIFNKVSSFFIVTQNISFDKNLISHIIHFTFIRHFDFTISVYYNCNVDPIHIRQ